MSREVVLYNEQPFSDRIANYMLLAENAADIRASHDTNYKSDLSHLLWCSHPSNEITNDKIELMKEILRTIATGFTSDMIVKKIAYHRTAIRFLDRTIADAQLPTPQTSPMQIGLIYHAPHYSRISLCLRNQLEIQITDIFHLEIAIKYRDIHRWCVSMLHAVVATRVRPTAGT